MNNFTSKSIKKSNTEKEIPVYSKVISDNIMIHSIMLANGKTSLLVCENGEINPAEEYFDQETGKTYVPAFDQYIKKQVVLLPSGAIGPSESTQLVKDVQRFLHKYVDLDEGFEEIAARYVVMSYVCDAFEKIPYLRVIGLYGTGKSRFLNVVGSIIHLPVFLGAAATSSNFFRMTDRILTGSLIVDEANFEHSGGSSILAQVLNEGYMRGGKVTRCVGKNYIPTSFEAFSPKVMAAHGNYSNAGLESRFLTHIMVVSKRPDLPTCLPPMNKWSEAEVLRQRLLNFRFEYFYKIDTERKFHQLSGFEPRTQEIARPLFQITPEDHISEAAMSFLQAYETSIVNNNRATNDGLVADALFSVPRHDGVLAYLADVVAQVNRNSDYRLSSKRVGGIIRVMGFSTWHTNAGTVMYLDPALMDGLTRRFGIQDHQLNIEVCNG